MSGAEPTVPCHTCGEPTAETGTQLCNRCWEVQRRLPDYLRAGGDKARAFVGISLLAVSTVDAEATLAADLWRRLITIWESAEEDELHDKLGALVDEWQGFVGGGRCACTHTIAEHKPGGCTKCSCGEEFYAAGDPREGFAAKEKKGT